MWCHYTCDPNQANFVYIRDFINVTDPTRENGTILAQDLDLNIDSQSACDLYASCKLTPYGNYKIYK